MKRFGFGRERKHGAVLAVMLGFLLLEVACSKGAPVASCTGKIDVSIFQANERLSLDEVAFEVNLPLGPIQQIPGRGFDKNSSGTRMASARSPNNVYTAVSSVIVPRFVGYPYAVLYVRNVNTGEAVFQSRFSRNEIDGVVWSADSNAVAVLTSSEHYSLNPKYWLRAASGHPKPIENYRLEIVYLGTHSNWGIDLPYESSAGFGQLRDWAAP
jgi:hypothetical protein